LAVSILLGRTASKTKEELNEERYSRMVAEEKLEKVSQKVKSLESQVNATQSKTEDIRGVLDQEKKTSAQLKLELEKMTKLKEVLEKELKEALTSPALSPIESGESVSAVTPPVEP